MKKNPPNQLFVLISYSFNNEVTGREPAAAELVGVGNLGTSADAVGEGTVADDDVIDVNAVPSEALAAVGRCLVDVQSKYPIVFGCAALETAVS